MMQRKKLAMKRAKTHREDSNAENASDEESGDDETKPYPLSSREGKAQRVVFK
ncbi:hypothetical protein YC2023_029172 [Brassica napus]